MKAIEILKAEHRIIEQVLTCLERMAIRATSEGRLPVQAANDAIRFFRGFADQCHHVKEEKELFSLLETKGFSPTCGPTAVMRFEHQQGREFIRGMTEAVDAVSRGDAAAIDVFARNARGYIELLRNHIAKEDHCLFAMADKVLSDADDQSLTESFEQAEHHEIGAGCHEEFARLADELATKFCVPRAMHAMPIAQQVGTCSQHASASA
jgi:hemerythrin-like domain-containing protein